MARKAKNRKKKVAGFILPIPFTGIIVAACGLGLGYVRLGNDCEKLGGEIKELEKESRLLARAVLTEEYQWSRMNSAANLRRALRKHNLAMDIPREDQIVRITAADLNGKTPETASRTTVLLARVKHE